MKPTIRLLGALAASISALLATSAFAGEKATAHDYGPVIENDTHAIAHGKAIDYYVIDAGPQVPIDDTALCLPFSEPASDAHVTVNDTNLIRIIPTTSSALYPKAFNLVKTADYRKDIDSSLYVSYSSFDTSTTTATIDDFGLPEISSTA